MAADNKEWSNHPTASLMGIEEKLTKGQMEEARSNWQERGAALGPKLLWSSTDCENYFDTKCLDSVLQKDENSKRYVFLNSCRKVGMAFF